MKNDITIFIGGVIKGVKSTRNRNLKQAEHIQAAIEQRWNISHPESWKVKHLRWFLHEQLKARAPETRYRYWLTTQILIERLGKTKDWTPHLKGPWTQR